MTCRLIGALMSSSLGNRGKAKKRRDERPDRIFFNIKGSKKSRQSNVLLVYLETDEMQ